MLAARYRLILTFSLIGHLPIHADNNRLVVIISSGSEPMSGISEMVDRSSEHASPSRGPETPIRPSIGVASDPLTPGRFQVPGFDCTRRRW
ncbi:hypothetical protein IWW34DRAFT_196691 [Fusarium oxysporum f. sp. albedinis]|nr:hypothetical protein IWW34DRAFT_196691 [Fusarium oxysporum f. sp. albedinis]